MAFEWRVEHVGHQGRAVHAQQGIARGPRRIAPGMVRKRGAHRVQHRLQPGRTLRVAGARVVRQAGGVGVEQHA